MLDPNYLDAIKKFEGYSAESRWDYAQNSNGYGTRARYAGEVIDKAEAERRFKDAVNQAADFVNKVAPGLDDGSKAALTSLTYNAGTAWAQSGLGEAIANGDMNKARSLFLQYNKAGGAVADGLVQRRLQEVTWFGQGATAAGNQFASLSSEVSSAAPEPTNASPLELAIHESTPVPSSVVRLAKSETNALPSSARAFADLTSDPALLALLVGHLGKSQPTRNPNEEDAAKPETSPQSI
jgi:lysozyme